MTRRVAIVGPYPSGQYGAASARLEALRTAFERAGWVCDSPPDSQPPSRPAVAPTRPWLAPGSVVRWFTRLGLAGDIRPEQAWQLRQWVRALDPTTVLVISVPPFSLLGLARLHPGPTLVDYRDVLSMATRPTVVARLLGPLERYTVNRYAGGVSAVGSDELIARMRRLLRVPLVHVPNGVTRDDLLGVQPQLARAPGPLQFVYSGELYGYADFRPISAAIATLPCDMVHLHVVTPSDPSTLRRYLDTQAANVTVHPPMPRYDLYRFLSRCDVGIVALTRQYPFEDSVPAKYYDYLAVGLSIMYVGPQGAAVLAEAGAERVWCAGQSESQIRATILKVHSTIAGSVLPGVPLVLDREVSAHTLVQLVDSIGGQSR